MNKITLCISVCADDWTTVRAMVASNECACIQLCRGVNEQNSIVN